MRLKNRIPELQKYQVQNKQTDRHDANEYDGDQCGLRSLSTGRRADLLQLNDAVVNIRPELVDGTATLATCPWAARRVT